MTRRLATVVGVAAMVALAGCATTISGTPTAGGGTDPARDKEFDPCALLDMEEVAQWVGTESMFITSADVMDHGGGSRSATCQYFPKDVPGMHGMNISYVSNVDPAEFFVSLEQNFDNVLPLDIGDRGAAVSYSADGTEKHFYEVRAIQGDRGLHMFYVYNGPGGTMPDVEQGAERWGAMLNTAFERLPDELDFPDGKPEGVCADVDVELAEKVLDAELTTARTVEGGNGGIACVFGGGSGRVAVTVVTEPTLVPDQAPKPADITHDDIGDGTRVRINEGPPGGQGQLDARARVDDAVVGVVASYGDGVTGITEPRPEDVDLVRSIVDTVGEQD